jgi:hypothetical protein
MKRHFNIPVALIMLLGVLTIGARAQSSSAQKLVANIPFAFQVGKTRLPAGKYTFTVMNPSSDRKILRIRNTNGPASAMTLTTNALGNAADDAKLVFHRYGDQYFFARAQMASDPTSMAAIRSKAERAEQQAVANSRKKSVVVILAE